MSIPLDELRRRIETDPVGHLIHLHRRMEQQLGILSSVARKRGCVLSTPQQKQFQAALSFCQAWLPAHFADVEQAQSLQLPTTAPPDAPPLLRIRQEHARLATLHREVEALGQRWMVSKTLPQPEALRLEQHIDQLQALFRPLFQAREQGLYAQLRQHLTPEALAQLQEGMLSRWRSPEPEQHPSPSASSIHAA